MSISNNNHPSSNLDIDFREALSYVLSRQITKLFKEFLFLLEKSGEEHTESLNKMFDALPEEYRKYVNLADWLTEDKAARLRKEVLQRGNDAIRSVIEELDKYDIDLRK